MQNVASMGAAEQAEFVRTMEVMQMKDSLKMYNRLVERCFCDCVEGFQSKTLNHKESECVDVCAEKFIKNTQRVGRRFAEHQATMQQQQ